MNQLDEKEPKHGTCYQKYTGCRSYGFGKIYRASWKSGYISRYKRHSDGMFVALKVLNNSQNVTLEFINEFCSVCDFGSAEVCACAQFLHSCTNPNSSATVPHISRTVAHNFDTMRLSFSINKEYSILSRKINNVSSTDDSSLTNIIHPEAVYKSSPLSFKNLSELKNSDNYYEMLFILTANHLQEVSKSDCSDLINLRTKVRLIHQ
ncbi:hypothetical protein RhiirA5_418730 [Rhizophagus irregularis]|uniref:Protein kinase domain-containing protein n=1 Tax=Rhizophagus irregularis TaxID=588596 RepID=A0A2N0PJP3_9GLOM|nr:hypothetical protein RhiirA5_418730 [Rhizophagus irregularis]